MSHAQFSFYCTLSRLPWSAMVLASSVLKPCTPVQHLSVLSQSSPACGVSAAALCASLLAWLIPMQGGRHEVPAEGRLAGDGATAGWRHAPPAAAAGAMSEQLWAMSAMCCLPSQHIQRQRVLPCHAYRQCGSISYLGMSMMQAAPPPPPRQGAAVPPPPLAGRPGSGRLNSKPQLPNKLYLPEPIAMRQVTLNSCITIP